MTKARLTPQQQSVISRLILLIILIACLFVALVAIKMVHEEGRFSEPDLTGAINSLTRPTSYPQSGEDSARQSPTGQSPTGQAPKYSRPLPGPFPAEVLRVIDGDTVEMRVTVWLGQEVTTRVRMRGIDAPELRARCKEELIKATAAKETLSDLLSRGEVFLTDVGYDKYGTRIVARIINFNRTDIGALLVAKELARPYGGGKRQSWCNSPDLPSFIIETSSDKIAGNAR